MRLAPPIFLIRLAPPIFITLILAACGMPPRAVQAWRWDRADTTAEVFAEDRRHCLRGATRTGSVLALPEVDPDRFATCMAARGYTRSDAGPFGGPGAKPPGGEK